MTRRLLATARVCTYLAVAAVTVHPTLTAAATFTALRWWSRQLDRRPLTSTLAQEHR